MSTYKNEKLKSNLILIIQLNHIQSKGEAHQICRRQLVHLL